jgi:hypothetical protein
VLWSFFSLIIKNLSPFLGFSIAPHLITLSCLLFILLFYSSILTTVILHPLSFLSFPGKYTAILAILIVGSFIIPMAQYFWYVKDDDSSDNFFAQKVPEPKAEPPKKKGWFNK